MKNAAVYKALKAAPADIDVPYEVWTCFGESAKYISLAGTQACFGGDFTDLTQLRKAIEWYAIVLGAKTLEWED